MKELNLKQARTSAETAKEVQNDKSLKTKNEKDRRLREKRQNNIKRFMEEKKVSRIQSSFYFIIFLILLKFYLKNII